MSDTGRKSMSSQLASSMKPDSQKAPTESMGDKATGMMDRVVGSMQPESQKSMTQKMGDSVRGSQSKGMMEHSKDMMDETMSGNAMMKGTSGQDQGKGMMDKTKDMMDETMSGNTMMRGTGSGQGKGMIEKTKDMMGMDDTMSGSGNTMSGSRNTMMKGKTTDDNDKNTMMGSMGSMMGLGNTNINTTTASGNTILDDIKSMMGFGSDTTTTTSNPKSMMPEGNSGHGSLQNMMSKPQEAAHRTMGKNQDPTQRNTMDTITDNTNSMMDSMKRMTGTGQDSTPPTHMMEEKNRDMADGMKRMTGSAQDTTRSMMQENRDSSDIGQRTLGKDSMMRMGQDNKGAMDTVKDTMETAKDNMGMGMGMGERR